MCFNEGIFNIMDTNKLSQLSKLWKKAQPIAPSFSNVPEGDYVADLKEMKLGESKKGRIQAELTLEIVDGDYTGKTVKRFDGVEEETGMGYFKNLCEVIGFDIPDNMEAWQEAMDEFVANNVKDLYAITVKQSSDGKYSNVYINNISEYTKGTEEEVEETATEEEVAVEEETTEEEFEVVEEEVQQEVVPPTKKTLVSVKPVAKVAVKPVAALPTKRVTTVQAQPVKKMVSLNRR